MRQCLSLSNHVKCVLVSNLEVVMKHLLAVEQIRAGLAQITQVHLHRTQREQH